MSDLDIESQQTALLEANNRPRSFRSILLIHQACQIFICKKGSLVLARSEQTEIDEVLSISSDVSINIRSDGEDASTVSDILQRSERTEIVEVLPTSLHVSDGKDDSTVREKLQNENIARIEKAEDLDSLHHSGVLQGIAEALNTDLNSYKGIPGNEEDLRCRRMDSSPALGFFRLLLKSSNNYIIFLLLVAAALSLGFGIKEEGPRTGWHEGVMIVLAVIILVVTRSIREFRREKSQKQSRKQSPLEKRQMVFGVVRGGNSQKVALSDIVFGDIVHLEEGCHVPGDGLLVSGEIYLKLYDGSTSMVDKQNPFISYGAQVITGHADMLVKSVGMNTAWGEMMRRVIHAPNNTPLAAQLDKVTFLTEIIGILITILLLVLLFLRFQLGKENHDSGIPNLQPNSKASKEVMDAIKRIVVKPSGKISVLTTSLTMLVVEIAEGVPFFISIAISYWNKKTLSDKAIAQDILACVNMGLVTTICTDKTGGLTLNPQEVHMCWIGEEIISEDSVVAPHVLEALCDGIRAPVLVLQNHDTSEEDPLLSWAAMKLGITMDIMKQSCSIVEAKKLAPNEEAHGVLIRKNGENGTLFSHWRGPATTILAKCSYYYDSEGTKKAMDGQKKIEFEQTIVGMQSKQLETVAFAYKKTDMPVPEEENLILLGLFGLKKTCWEKTIEEIKICRNAGVSIILVSGDDVSELKKIALKCELVSSDSDAMIKKGEEFRNCTHEERMKMVDEISVMGNSLPADRFLLVQCLKEKGHTVAVAVVTANEIPALKEADVGLAMGTWSSNMARENYDIIIWEDSFSFLVTVLKSGRCTYENIQKYIQLELTMFVAGLLINCITTVTSGDSPITAIQLIWVNLVVAIVGGLALLTEPPTEKLMKKPPVVRKKPLITKAMWRNILSQTLYQTAIIITFHLEGKAILHINDKVSKTIAFNSFLLCQVFNLFNARELEMKNVFKGIHQNKWFWVVSVIVTVVSQEAFLEIAHFVVGDAELNYKHWAVCILIGIPSWVIDWVTKWTWDFIMNWLTTEPHTLDL